MVKPDLNATAKERIKGMLALSTCVHELIDFQMDETIPDSSIQEKQAELNRLYDSFTEKYGLINSRGNKLALILLTIAFLFSPMGLPMIAVWILSVLQGMKGMLKSI